MVATPQDANELRKKGVALFVDARSIGEFEISHVPGAYSLPWVQRLIGDRLISLADAHPSHTIFIYSDNGRELSRDARILQVLRNRLQGSRVRQALRLAGGLNAWKEKGFPVEGDSRMMVLGQAVNGREELAHRSDVHTNANAALVVSRFTGGHKMSSMSK